MDQTLEVACVAIDKPVSTSAEALHRTLVTAHKSGNVARRCFADGLRAMAESRLFVMLGYPTLMAYARKHFKYSKTQILEHVRVSKALDGLTGLSAAFASGELSWSLLVEVTRVAKTASEEKWLAMARTQTVERVLAEIRHAIHTGRSEPRDDGYGLPAMMARMVLSFSPSELALAENAIEKLKGEMRQSGDIDTASITTTQAVLYAFSTIVGTSPGGSVAGNRVERDDASFVVVAHRCPDCERATVETNAGRVELDAEEFERIERVAELVVIEEPSSGDISKEAIDPPNTPAIRELVRHRAGLRCENPFCRQACGERGHGHHVIFRSRGGRTNPENVHYVCVACHALIHLQLLLVYFDDAGELRWRTGGDDVARRLRAELEAAHRLPVIQIVQVSGSRDDPSNPDTPMQQECIKALTDLGYSRTEAERRAASANARLPAGGTVTDLIKEALRNGSR